MIFTYFAAIFIMDEIVNDKLYGRFGIDSPLISYLDFSRIHTTDADISYITITTI